MIKRRNMSVGLEELGARRLRSSGEKIEVEGTAAAGRGGYRPLLGSALVPSGDFKPNQLVVSLSGAQIPCP